MGDRILGPLVVSGPAAALVLLLFGLTGCEPGSSEPTGGGPGFTQTDSAGIIISVTQGGEANSPIGWEVDSIPDFVIGAEDSLSLYRVQGVTALSDGGVLVVNGGSRELLFFDSGGHLQRRAGGDGEGPGEFRDPVLVPWAGSDSLLFFDKLIPRLQVFSSDGQQHRTIRHEWPRGRIGPLGATGDRDLLWPDREWVGGQASLSADGLRQNIDSYFWYDPATAEENKLPFASLVDVRYRSRTMRAMSGLSSMMIPFRSLPAVAVIDDGVLITDGRTLEIQEYDREGRLRGILRVNQPGRPVTPEMIGTIEVWREGYTSLSTLSGSLRRSIEAELPIPDTLPAIQSLLVDSRGWLWAQAYDWDPAQPKEWMVFDPEGEAQGVVWTPPGLEVESIGEDFILGVWLDEFDVEYVRRHRLRRAKP